MNEQLQEALATIIIKATEGVEAGVAFLSDEMPDVLYQILLWYGVYNALMCALGVGILSLLALGWVKCSGKGESNGESGHSKRFTETLSHNNRGELDERVLLLGSVTLFISVVTCGLFINLEWLKIWLAPKLWLIEYAATLAK